VNSLKILFEEEYEVKREGEKKKFLAQYREAHSAVIACLFSFFQDKRRGRRRMA
jgi:hypothetical protein